MIEQHPIIIIGGGLSGLYIAWRLHQRQQNAVVLEARDRCGGRILSPNLGQQANSGVDLGPAWLWPQLQPRLGQLLAELDIELFKQYTTGDILYESDAWIVERYGGQSSHDQSYRIAGGSQSLINRLTTRLPESALRLNTRVTAISPGSKCLQATHGDQSLEFTADRIILALPPRITQKNITFDPPLPGEINQLWSSIPTWMAGHCKLVFTYDLPFWREQNLSGEVFSRCGPLTEIYDGSPASEEFYALTSFAGINAQQRMNIGPERLTELSMDQLKRLFGEKSQNVKDIQSKDWSQDQHTATAHDLNTQGHHPQYPGNMVRNLWDGRLILAGTEVAREHGGYLEGALESADEALALLY